MVLKPGSEEAARKIFEKWELDFAVVGLTNDTNHLTITHQGDRRRRYSCRIARR